MSKLIQTVVLMLTMAVGAVMMPSPSHAWDPMPIPPQPPKPDLVVADMFFTFAETNGEFLPLDLVVLVENIGFASAGAYSVKAFRTNISTPIGFDAMYPLTATGGSLGVGEVAVFEWTNVGIYGTWMGYFLAVVDMPSQTHPLGSVDEGPDIHAEKNNTLAVPSPTPP